MADITLMGATYHDVPAVTLPSATPGETVTFYENGGGGVDVESLSVTANGTYTAPTGKAYSPVVVNVSGGVSADRKDVNFYDYDGSIVASYTTAEFANIDALPSNPSHTGLTAQGWNMPSGWTLANAKTYVATNKKADWGQMYTTASGKTEIDVEFSDPNRLSPNMCFAVNGTVTVDWGDGSAADTVTGTSLATKQSTGNHTYPAVGKYTIKIMATTGSWGFYVTSTYTFLYKNENSATNENRVYANCVQNIRIGAGCKSIGNSGVYYCSSLKSISIPNSLTSIGSNAFYYCYALSFITIPNSVTSISGSTFYYCVSLKSVLTPNSVTSIGTSVFYYCYSLTSISIPSGVTSIGTNTNRYCNALTSVSIPNSVTSIGSNAFNSCASLTSITIPSSVTSIGTKAFQNCNGLGSIHFKGSTPPTVDAADAFASLPTDCKIYVPTGKLSTYTGTSNYPSSSTYTYIEE